jgi:hypothetical protein
VLLVIVRNRRGKQIWHTIGKTAHYTVAEAREKARQIFKGILGAEPVAHSRSRLARKRSCWSLFARSSVGLPVGGSSHERPRPVLVLRRSICQPISSRK